MDKEHLNVRYLTTEDISAIEKALDRGERVELIPVREGVKILRIRREELKIKYEPHL